MFIIKMTPYHYIFLKNENKPLRNEIAISLGVAPHHVKLLLNNRELLPKSTLADLATPEQLIAGIQLKYIHRDISYECDITVRKLSEENCIALNLYTNNFAIKITQTEREAIHQFYQAVIQCNIEQVAKTVDQDRKMIDKVISLIIRHFCDMPKNLMELSRLYQAFFQVNKKINEADLKAHINSGLSAILKIMTELNTIQPYLFKDEGTYGHLRAILEYDYLDEIEKELSTANKIKRYQQIVDLTQDLNDHPEESKALRGFILGTGNALNEEGSLESSYNEEVNTQFDAIRHALIKKQTFSQDKSLKYISHEALMAGFFSLVMIRIQELKAELKLEATLKIQKQIKLYHLSSKLSACVEKIENSHKLVKDFIQGYESTRSNLAVQDIYQKQRINFVIEKANKYEQAVRMDEKFRTAKNTSLVFFKQGKAKETISYLEHAHEQLIASRDKILW